MTEENRVEDTSATEEEKKPVLDAEGLRGQLEYLAFTVLANVDRIQKGLITEGAAAQTDESMAANMAAVLYIRSSKRRFPSPGRFFSNRSRRITRNSSRRRR